MRFVSEVIEQYCKDYSGQDNDLLKELTKNTWETEEIPQMLCGPLVGGLLQFLMKNNRSCKCFGDRNVHRIQCAKNG